MVFPGLRLEFELTYSHLKVQYLGHYALETPSSYLWSTVKFADWLIFSGKEVNVIEKKIIRKGWVSK